MSRRNEIKPYKPNVVSTADRVFNSLLGALLSIYGVVGLLTAHVDLNGRRIRIAVLEGGPAWLMAAAMLVGAVVLYSVVIDHYDRRNNERYYQTFHWIATRLGWCLAMSALVLHLYLGFTR
ncbi:MAG: hypothetical protein NDI67_10325 [Sulfuritalea sp.]|nr:hypothetical protein [Sulfuritalea sp.]